MRVVIGYDGSEYADAALDDSLHAGPPRDAEALIISIAEGVMGPLSVFRGRRECARFPGLDATLRAFRLGRIWRLVYADSFAPLDARRVNCGTLFEEKPESCAYCGSAVRPVDDLVEQAARAWSCRAAKLSAWAEPWRNSLVWQAASEHS
jgi:hypothetical protein